MKKLILFTAHLLIFIPLSAQVTLWQEDFEDHGNSANGGAARYTSNNDFYDSATDDDYFGRVDGNTLEYFLTNAGSGFLINTNVVYAGFSGTFYYAAEDLDDTGAPIGTPDGLDEKSITFNAVDVSNGNILTFKGLFARGENSQCAASTYDGTDYIRVYYNLDGGGEILALQFSADIECNIPADVSNEPLHHDPDMDGDGGEGIQLTNNFQEFSFAIPNGNSVIVRLEVHMDAASEEIAFDNFRIEAMNLLNLDELDLNAQISIYPIPSTGIINMRKPSSIELHRAAVYNVIGKLVHTFDLSEIGSNHVFDLSQLDKGIYLLQIESKKGEKLTKKLVIN